MQSFDSESNDNMPMTNDELSAVLRKWKPEHAPSTLEARVFSGTAHGSRSSSRMLFRSVMVPIPAVAVVAAVLVGLTAWSVIVERKALTVPTISAPALALAGSPETSSPIPADAANPGSQTAAPEPQHSEASRVKVPADVQTAKVSQSEASQASLASATELTPAELTLKKSIGSASAPIKLEIFSDYECAACREMYLDATRHVIDDYVSTGKVYLVHRDFPLSVHAHSLEAARWINAAAAAGSFQAAELALYTKQDQWGATGNIEQALASYLSTTEMNKIRAGEEAQSAALDAAVQSDMNLGNTRNVSGTPSIFVTFKDQVTPLPPGPVPYSLLKQYLDSLLALSVNPEKPLAILPDAADPSSRTAAPEPQNGTASQVRVQAEVQSTKAVRRIPPVYPPDAKANGVEGIVILHAIIATDGTVKELTALSGDPVFRSAAIAAVRQWVYEPTLLKGKPVEVDTTVTVTFILHK